ncbi:CG1092, partial [Drosophila busckii]
CLAQMPSHPVAYTRHLSELRIKELHELAKRMELSINSEKYACDSFYDYVCSRNRPLFSIMGHIPQGNDLIQLFTKLQNDKEQFEAKQKMIDFFISCNSHKSLHDCYRETFEYFKPLFGYIITKDVVLASSHDLQDFQAVLDGFVNVAKTVFNLHSHTHPLLDKLKSYKEKFRTPNVYFYAGELNREYGALRIYRESYEHNLRNLDLHRRRNSSYELGVQRTMLDWSLYLYQSRNKPMSYYFPTFTVHLYMSMFNQTERQRDFRRFPEETECLKLPPYVNVLGEARMLAVIYLKSFRQAWQDYSSWILSSDKNREIYDDENEILKAYQLNNKRLFFTLYAQNFCEFGKELAEHFFYLGLQQNTDFFNIYSCGYQTEYSKNCI